MALVRGLRTVPPRRSYCFFSGAGAAAAGLAAGLGFQKTGLAFSLHGPERASGGAHACRLVEALAP